MRDFQDMLTDLDEGKVHERATTLMAELVASVMETNRKGKFSLTLHVSRQGDMALVKAEIKTTKPEPAVESTMFFTTVDGELRRDDPRQLKLRNVAPVPTPLKTVKPGGEGEGN